jgi:hypothetical protein
MTVAVGWKQFSDLLLWNDSGCIDDDDVIELKVNRWGRVVNNYSQL